MASRRWKSFIGSIRTWCSWTCACRKWTEPRLREQFARKIPEHESSRLQATVAAKTYTARWEAGVRGYLLKEMVHTEVVRTASL